MSRNSYPKRIVGFALLCWTIANADNCEAEAAASGERERAQWRIGMIDLEDARAIAEIRRLAAECSKASDVDVAPLLAVYSETDSPLLRFVILDQFAELGRLATIKDYSDPLADFATLLEEDKVSATRYLQQVADPVLKSRLQAWVVMREGPEAVEGSRQEEVAKWRRRLDDEIAGLSTNERARLLFENLSEWESPLTYEACFSLVKRMYQAQPDLVVNSLKEALLRHVPSEDPPPPYSREHVVFHEFCFLAMIIGDPRLIESLESTASSPNQFVRYKANTALKWLKQNVVYPWEFEDAGLAYRSDG